MKKAAVFGLALAGTAVARALVERDFTVVMSDDKLNDEHRALARELNCTVVDLVGDVSIDEFLTGVDVLVPAPGVSPQHSVIMRALEMGISVRTEIDLAYEWEQARPGGPRPILAVTGTDGKTTTTMLVAALLRGAGYTVAEVGNTDVPFVAALNDDVDVFVAECSSFRLQFTQCFRSSSSVWLNIAPDHIDWHGTFDSYVSAKARMWKFATSNDVAIVPVDVALISDAARLSQARVVTFGVAHGDYYVADNMLMSPVGPIASVDSLWRTMPHDITNSLAACAVVLESGLVRTEQLGATLSKFVSAPHRIELVGNFGGVDWFDDSKATSPHAALTAIRAFDSVVLIAGGKNKDLDLTELAIEPHRIHGVIAIGYDAPAIQAAFAEVCPVQVATSMAQAVELATQMSNGRVPVLLSPACTSYDWYRNYNERGDDFQKCVKDFFDTNSGVA
ncbi:MAG: UDP-N-acetylmuramoyl-L-alanine--D-glutamate ligase [Actinobacteria bacterium]|nr:UDP-N-acetylmuramoyl-L-alanine--D-glutamate ligase [Actinomycetota bacterium]